VQEHQLLSPQVFAQKAQGRGAEVGAQEVLQSLQKAHGAQRVKEIESKTGMCVTWLHTF
jgi:hypothetical protein